MEWVQVSRPDQPRMQLKLQPYRSRFDRDAYNGTILDMLDDLDLLFGESVDTAIRVLKGLNADDVRHKALRYQLGIIDDLLEGLLLVEPGATGYFFNFFDSFNDLSDVDMDQTTAEVDLETGSVRLPSVGGVHRLDLGFLQNRERANLRVNSDAVVSSGLVAGTKFGNLFDDIIGSCWAAVVVTTEDRPLTTEFSIPISVQGGLSDLATAESQSRHVSRIDVDPLTSSPMDLDVLHSIDGQNWNRMPGYAKSVQILAQRVTLSFPSTLIKFLKFRMTKQPDSVNPGQCVFSFGMRGIGLYNTGYADSAELVSNVIVPEGPDDSIISKIALDVDERVPVNTNIEYFVSLGVITPDWMKISPGSREQDAPRTVEFGSAQLSPRNDNRFRVQATPAIHSTRNGITFYTVHNTLAGAIPRSARLFRGINAWRRKTNEQEMTQSVRNNYVVFTLTDSEQRLYLEVEEEEVTNPPASTGLLPTEIPVAHEVFQDASMPMTPEHVGTPRESPLYSIRKVERLFASGVGGTGANGATITALPSYRRATVVLPLAIARGAIGVGQYIYIGQAGAAGYYRVDMYTEGATVDVTVEDPASALSNGVGVTWSVGYEDITGQVQGIAQNRIEIAVGQTILATDVIRVSYRRPLGADERLVTSSVVVKSATDESSTYTAGRDYIVKGASKSVARLAEGRITGITDQVIVRVDFQYKVSAPELDTYSAFFYVDSDEPKEIELGAMIGVADDERVFIGDGSKVHNVSNDLKFPRLPRGWRQVVVRSNPLVTPAGALDVTSAIYRVLTLTDSLGNFIFQPNTRYFTKQTAFPEAMRETNLFKLQTGVRIGDHGWFTVDGTNVVVNWDPTTMPDTIYPVVTAGPIVTLLTYEQFEMEYRYTTGHPPDQTLYFKAVFTREPKLDRGVTPELKSYNLKFSH